MTKSILLYIIDILKDTDEFNKSTRTELERKLNEIGVGKIDRHTIKKCIDELNDFGFDIAVEKGKKNEYYLRERLFEEWEIKLLCDMVCECNFLSQKDISALINKLRNFTGIRNRKILDDTVLYYGQQNSGHVNTKYIIDDILSAISDDKKIEFQYCEYDDKLNKVVKEKVYIVSPYKLVLKNGRYYLLLNKDGHNDVVFYRVDRIGNVHIRGEKRKNIVNLLGKNYENELNNIIKRRLYNYDGDCIKLVIKVKRTALGEIIDNFYDGTIVLNYDEEYLTIAVNTTKSEGLYYWLMQHLDTVIVVKPESVRDELIARVEKVIEEYRN